MTYGGYLRAKPRINVMRGFVGNEPQSITLSAPPRDADGTIKSGMLISIDPTTGAWIPASTGGGTSVSGNAYSADAKNTISFFAFSDDTDTDVKSSGLLLGLSCLGEFELQTGYFDTTTTYPVGTPLIKSATGGSLAKGGDTLSATEVVGYVTGAGKEDLMHPLNASGRVAPPINSEATPDVNGAVYVLSLITRWKPAQS